VLSYGFWRSHFLGDPGVIGRVVQVNKHAFTVLGVAAPEFRGTELFFSPALWVPLVDQGQIDGFDYLKQRTGRNIWLVGRLKPNVTAAQAEADLHSIATFLSTTYPKDDDRLTFSLARSGLLGNMLGQPVRAFVTGLMLLAGLILLAALREPGQSVCSPGSGSLARNCFAPGAWIDPAECSAATPGRGDSGCLDRRDCGHCG
jgi:hypothetical protein